VSGYNETAITARRNELGMTQAEVAAKAGVSLATWRRFEQSPSLGYRGDTIRGVLRALKLGRDELTRLLEGSEPTVSGSFREKAWVGPWNELWREIDWPSITPRMACAIQVALDSARDMLESSIGGSDFDPEESPVLQEFDARIFIEVGDNRAWFRAMARRMKHLVDAMEKGQLIDKSCECFADAALFGAAVRDAAALWDMSEEMWPGVNDDLPSQLDDGVIDEEDTAGEDDDTWDDGESRWGDFTDDLDDRMPYREWDCVFREYRMTRHLLNYRPVKTWFDEPDHELEGFRKLAPSHILAQELMSPAPSRAEVWVDDRSQIQDED
jgi:transcriptional regulator with XRE-family HTH domain